MAVPFPRGVFAAPPTPFGPDESLQVGRAAAHARWFAERGAHGLVVAGSGGEFVALTASERMAIADAVLDAVGARLPVIVCIAEFRTAVAIELGRHAVRSGAAGVLATAPYYMRPSPGSVRRHFAEIRQAVDAPLMFYNAPGNSGVELPHEMIVGMVEEGIFQGVKQSYADAFHLRELKLDVGERAAVFAGHDASAFECLIDGADGWISTFPTVFPERARRLWDDIQRGADLNTVRAHWEAALPFVRFVYDDALKSGGDPHWLDAFKTAMNLVGVDVGPPRAPFHLLEGDALQRLRAIVAELSSEEVAPIDADQPLASARL
jgi:4-hydroxy-tetrahydrodipicolinate synthase